MAEDLSDKAIQLLDAIEQANVQPPAFKLGPEEDQSQPIQTEMDYTRLAWGIWNPKSVLTPRQQVLKSLGLEDIPLIDQMKETVTKATQALELYVKQKAEELSDYQAQRFGKGMIVGN